MKKNLGSQLALYPTPLVVVGTMIEGKPNWVLVGKIDYDKVRPVLFEGPTYYYVKTGDITGPCIKLFKVQ